MLLDTLNPNCILRMRSCVDKMNKLITIKYAIGMNAQKEKNYLYFVLILIFVHFTWHVVYCFLCTRTSFAVAHLLVQIVLDYELNGLALATVAKNPYERQQMERFDTISEAIVDFVEQFQLLF